MSRKITARKRHERIAEIDREVEDFVRAASDAKVPLPEGFTERLEERNEHTKKIFEGATQDSKTGVYNASTFAEEAQDYMERKGNGYSTLVILDMDKFKQLNDSLGHEAGDMAIRRMGRVLRSASRKSDYKNVTGRFGGDEFVVYIDDSTEDVGLLVTERVYKEFERRKEISIKALERKGASEKTIQHVRDLTLSGGITTGTDYDSMFRNADSALYEAKRGGRDRIYAYMEKPEWLPDGYILSEDAEFVHVCRVGNLVNGNMRKTRKIGSFSAMGATRKGILEAIDGYETFAD